VDGDAATACEPYVGAMATRPLRRSTGGELRLAATGGWLCFGLSVAFVLVAAVLVRGAPTDVPGLEVATAEDVVDSVLDLAFPLVGALVLTRAPGNLFGWAFCLVGLCFEASIFAGAYSTYATFTHPGSLPAGRLLSLASDVLFVLTFVLYLTFVPLLFPTGRPPTRRWWTVGAAAALTILLAATSMIIRPGPVDEDVPTAGPNPLGIAGAGDASDALELAGIVLLFAATLGAFASVVVRARRSSGEERRQLKIFFTGVAIVVAVFVLPTDLLGLDGAVAQIALAVLALTALPATVALALLARDRAGSNSAWHTTLPTSDGAPPPRCG
jgi:hypothetical protein